MASVEAGSRRYAAGYLGAAPQLLTHTRKGLGRLLPAALLLPHNRVYTFPAPCLGILHLRLQLVEGVEQKLSGPVQERVLLLKARHLGVRVVALGQIGQCGHAQTRHEGLHVGDFHLRIPRIARIRALNPAVTIIFVIAHGKNSLKFVVTKRIAIK